MYRSHDLHNTEFILKVKQYLQLKRNVKNHLIIGDFNINIMLQNNISQNFLYNFLENGFSPGFTNTNRPYNITTDSDIFIKTSSINAKTFKLMTLITDQYLPPRVSVKLPAWLDSLALSLSWTTAPPPAPLAVALSLSARPLDPGRAPV